MVEEPVCPLELYRFPELDQMDDATLAHEGVPPQVPARLLVPERRQGPGVLRPDTSSGPFTPRTMRQTVGGVAGGLGRRSSGRHPNSTDPCRTDVPRQSRESPPPIQRSGERWRGVRDRVLGCLSSTSWLRVWRSSIGTRIRRRSIRVWRTLFVGTPRLPSEKTNVVFRFLVRRGVHPE